MTSRWTSNRVIYIFLTISFALLSVNGAENQLSNDKLQDPLQVQRRQVHKSTEQSKTFLNEIEDVLKEGEELRLQIIKTLGEHVYDRYNELSFIQLETLYCIYQNTLRRKYNIFEAALRLQQGSESLGASDICEAMYGNLCMCKKNYSQVCSSLKSIDKRRSVKHNDLTNLTKIIRKYRPERLTPQVLLRRFQKGELRMTPKLLIGLLQNIQFDRFDYEVQRMKKLLSNHLAQLDDLGLVYNLSSFTNIRNHPDILKKLLRDNGVRFPLKERRAALMLVDHIEQDVNSISDNIEHFGAIYEKKSIDFKYLFELVLPEDLVDSDIVKARNNLVQVIVEYNVLDKLSIEKYKHTSPAQLFLEILRRLEDILPLKPSSKNVIQALSIHAKYWRKDTAINNVSDCLKLFRAYDNLIDNPNYKDFFDTEKLLKKQIASSKHVELELNCAMPRPCLRRALLKVMKCKMVDNDTKQTLKKLLNFINSKGSPLVVEKIMNSLDYKLLDKSKKSSATDEVAVTSKILDHDVSKKNETSMTYTFYYLRQNSQKNKAKNRAHKTTTHYLMNNMRKVSSRPFYKLQTLPTAPPAPRSKLQSTPSPVIPKPQPTIPPAPNRKPQPTTPLVPGPKLQPTTPPVLLKPQPIKPSAPRLKPQATTLLGLRPESQPTTPPTPVRTPQPTTLSAPGSKSQPTTAPVIPKPQPTTLSAPHPKPQTTIPPGLRPKPQLTTTPAPNSKSQHTTPPVNPKLQATTSPSIPYPQPTTPPTPDRNLKPTTPPVISKPQHTTPSAPRLEPQSTAPPIIPKLHHTTPPVIPKTQPTTPPVPNLKPQPTSPSAPDRKPQPTMPPASDSKPQTAHRPKPQHTTPSSTVDIFNKIYNDEKASSTFPNMENRKAKLCSTKDSNRKRKNERLHTVRQLSNLFIEEETSQRKK